MNKLGIGDKVELLRNELFDNHYQESKRTIVARGTIMTVVAITPKVRIVKGKGCDGKPCFLNLELPDSNNHNRVRTDFCNVRKIRNKEN